MSYYISEMEEKDLRSDEDSNQEKEEGSNKEPEQTKSDEDWRPEEEESGSMRRKRQVCRKRSTDFEGNLTHGKPRFSIWDHSSPIHLDVLYKGGEGRGRGGHSRIYLFWPYSKLSLQYLELIFQGTLHSSQLPESKAENSDT